MGERVRCAVSLCRHSRQPTSGRRIAEAFSRPYARRAQIFERGSGGAAPNATSSTIRPTEAPRCACAPAPLGQILLSVLPPAFATWQGCKGTFFLSMSGIIQTFPWRRLSENIC
ncbi:hypothetical protein TRICHSKD4_5973 [Roseibium sp. TrichSKD4]|nr:hypothetical protein TRICHSKD4_5973 [Roseibium sp. TrichSKD4]